MTIKEYASSIRRKLHMYPEVGYDLPMTLNLLRDELEHIGVPYTEQFGKSSIVATVNPEKAHFTIGVRADMDALPITEANDVPYKSQIIGQMHACGHDAHTAIALTTLKKVWEMRNEISCCVKFLFQSGEECAPSGAMLMAKDGVMEDIDCIVALHCNPSTNSGQIDIAPGATNATSDGFLIDFYGRSSHVANQEAGVDAISMAVRAYTDITFMIAKEISAKKPVIFNVGSIHGGEANNIICDHCTMFCTLRTQENAVAEYILDKIHRIIDAVAATSNGRAVFTPSKHYPITFNNAVLTQRLRAAAEKVVGLENINVATRGMGGEDFSYFAMEKPGCIYRLGVRNEGRGFVHGLHQDRFDLDEDALEVGVNIFLQFILDNMQGIAFN